MSLRRSARSAAAAEPDSAAAATAAGVALLAGRDYASGELRAKLSARGFAACAIEAALENLTNQGALNEARYAQNYVAWHAGRGQGPLRIAAELRRHGVAETLIVGALQARTDWAELARKACHAKFGAASAASWRDRARRMRFLQYRGFSADHIRVATGDDPDWVEEA
jgi:regulatory protein